MTPARSTTAATVLNDNIGLVWFHVNRHPHVRFYQDDEDELFQAACLMFLDRFETFDGQHLSLFIRWMVQWSARKLRRPAAFNQFPMEEYDLDDILTASHDRDPFEDVDRRLDAERVHRIVNKLPPQYRAATILRFGLDGQPPRTVAVIAASLGMGCSRASAVISHAVTLLASRFTDEDLAALMGSHVKPNRSLAHRPCVRNRPARTNGRPVAVCRHCSNRQANRPRGLCWGCYYTPGLKDRYPSTSKFAPLQFRSTAATPSCAVVAD